MRDLPIEHIVDGLIISLNDYSVKINGAIQEVENCSDIWATYRIERPQFTDLNIWRRSIFDIFIEYRYFNDIIIIFHSAFVIERVNERIQMQRDMWNCFDFAREIVMGDITDFAKGKNGIDIVLPPTRINGQV